MSLLSHIHFEFLTTKQWMGGWIDGIVGRLGPTGRSITIRRQLWAVKKSVVAVLLITHSYANKAKSSEMWWDGDDNKLSGSWRRLKSSKMIGSGESKIYNQRRRKHMIWLMHTTIIRQISSHRLLGGLQKLQFYDGFLLWSEEELLSSPSCTCVKERILYNWLLQATLNEMWLIINNPWLSA